jgi:hypothetical protein
MAGGAAGHFDLASNLAEVMTTLGFGQASRKRCPEPFERTLPFRGRAETLPVQLKWEPVNR